MPVSCSEGLQSAREGREWGNQSLSLYLLGEKRRNGPGCSRIEEVLPSWQEVFTTLWHSLFNLTSVCLPSPSAGYSGCSLTCLLKLVSRLPRWRRCCRKWWQHFAASFSTGGSVRNFHIAPQPSAKKTCSQGFAPFDNRSNLGLRPGECQTLRTSFTEGSKISLRGPISDEVDLLNWCNKGCRVTLAGNK